MAADEAIWQEVAAGQAPPTLRLYAWDPPCLSLGRHQPVSEIRREVLRAAGYDVVRRPTGGRAILHADELTYSLVVPLRDPRVRGDVLVSCRQLSQGLLRALTLLGVREATAYQSGGNTTPPSPVCFEDRGSFEITVGGRKLIGSAQMRGRGALLQHGALPLGGDIACICSFLAVPADPVHVRSRATTLEQVLGHQISWGEATKAVTAGFAHALNLQLERGSLTSREQSAMAQLCTEKYAAEEWTARL